MADAAYAVDFFVSHADADTQWAEWIAAELESAGYGVIVKAWDFRPGENTMVKLDEAMTVSRSTICVLSPAYFSSEVAAQVAAHYQGLIGKERALIPIRVADCAVPPLMGSIIPIDLADVDDENEARRRLLAGVADRADRMARGGFPKSPGMRAQFPQGRHETEDHVVAESPKLAGHAFISYVREDSHKVNQLQQRLEAAGVQVWRDTANLWPGEDWRAKIRHAITVNTFVFIACFSHKSAARKVSYQNEELNLAVDQLRLRRPSEVWLVPVRFADCDIPDLDIGGGRTLASIQRADLFGDRYEIDINRLVATVRRLLD